MFIVARAWPPPTTLLQTARATPRHTTRRRDREIMAAAAAALFSHRFSGRPSFPPRPSDGFLIFFCPSYLRVSFHHRRSGAAVCFVLKEVGTEPEKNDDAAERPIEVRMSVAERTAIKQAEQRTYLVAAVMSTLAITSMAVAGVYYRFYWQMEGGEVPLSEAFGTFALSVGASVGMELWARWAHRALWHASLWPMHESHHRPRDGPFELNDVFAIVNAVPAISLLAYGFLNRGLLPGLCFGAGLGITLFGIAYMFVHDGLVHRRFPVGPIANVPYFRRVAAAHQIHHMDKFDGVPYGLFLGPKELEEVGGTEELEKEVARRTKLHRDSDPSS